MYCPCLQCPLIVTALFLIAAIIFLISTIVLAVILEYRSRNPNKSDPISNIISSVSDVVNPTETPPILWPKPSGSLYGRFKRAAIATDNGMCSEIGRDVLLLGGNVIDATIAALICTGVVNPQSSGLGGGFMMTIFNSTTGRCVTVNARETAPQSANQSMLEDSSSDFLTGYSSVLFYRCY
ncbi:unnamed protein product [Anisakis simplex]|uniref:Gamma-glutamyltranspeptidase 1 n=1 Tax=Anisakis simplex TaxID=6269 RepID=A0A0M3KFL9_ANISI|nr:unnamed protein product [Anisakis simplex]